VGFPYITNRYQPRKSQFPVSLHVGEKDEKCTNGGGWVIDTGWNSENGDSVPMGCDRRISKLG
jgi:hypothetical protein